MKDYKINVKSEKRTAKQKRNTITPSQELKT